MKKIILTLGILLKMSLLSYSQIVVNQSLSSGPYKVGDTITVTYNVDKGTTKPRYFWLRYQYNNKALTYVSTSFSQGNQSQHTIQVGITISSLRLPIYLTHHFMLSTKQLLGVMLLIMIGI